MSEHLTKPLAPLIEPILSEQGLLKDPPLDSSVFAQLTITGVTNDSRQVQPGNAFFCIQGEHQNGNDFVDQAVQNGAVCIFSQDLDLKTKTPFIAVNNARAALALASNYFFDNPSTKLRLLGVTGTNGKTTTTHLVEHVLLAAGYQVGLIGTLGARWRQGNGERKEFNFGQTTPQAHVLQKMLYDMAQAGVSHVVMEVSSHALALKHVAGCHFAAACLTNITQDHLDFHKSMEQYWQAKRLLFEGMNSSQQSKKHALINLDEPLAPEFLKVLGAQVPTLTYGLNKSADLHLIKAHYDFQGSLLELSTPQGNCQLQLQLNGMFNTYNVMAALSICLAEGINLMVAKEALESFSGVPGRFEVVTSDKSKRLAEPLCIVDYAHTPDGLANILKAARQLVPETGQLFVVFGCGGDRDNSKRPQMGEIAEELADQVTITSDNPRSEDPHKIIAEILAGISRLSKVQTEPDRSKAIKLTIDNASPQDVVVIAGKGHEDYQIIGKRTIPFDDRLHVREALRTKSQLPQSID